LAHQGCPPCDECEFPENPDSCLEAIKAWKVLNSLRKIEATMAGSFPQTIGVVDILDYCRAFDLTDLDFRKIVTIEESALPLIREAHHARNKAKT
jgi:hypothetical protein